MTVLWLVIGAALPSTALIALICWLDRKRPEPLRLLLWAVFWGILATLPVLLASPLLAYLSRLIRYPLLTMLWTAYGSAALVEEGCKYLILQRGFFRNPVFDQRMDGIVYAMSVSLGFAFAENLLYGLDGRNVLILRAFTAVPLHAAASGLMGYFVAVSMENGQKQGSQLRLAGFGLAVFIHGSYNFLLFLGGAAVYGALLVLLVGGLLFRSVVHKAFRHDASRLMIERSA